MLIDRIPIKKSFLVTFGPIVKAVTRQLVSMIWERPDLPDGVCSVCVYFKICCLFCLHFNYDKVNVNFNTWVWVPSVTPIIQSVKYTWEWKTSRLAGSASINTQYSQNCHTHREKEKKQITIMDPHVCLTSGMQSALEHQ